MSESLKEVSQKISDEIKKVSSSSNKSGLNSALENLEQVAKESLEKASKEIKSSSNSTDKPGFVAGDGSKYSFSALSNVDGKLSIDHNQIGADIVRILLEAARDAFYPLPVSKDSTLALNQDGKTSKKKIENLNVIVFNKEENKKDWQNFNIKITDEEFNKKILTKANRSEAEIATAVGKAIRGGLIGSLNNEALAKTIETAAGVVARHTRERFEWCSFVQEQKVAQRTGEIDSLLLTGL